MEYTAVAMKDILEKENIRGYNSALDTAICLVEAVLKHSDPDLLETIVCGLENSKIKKDDL